MVTGLAVIEKRAVLRTLEHLIPDRSSGPYYTHPMILRALADVIANSLTLPVEMTLRKSKLSRDWRDTIVGQIYKAGSRDLVGNYRPFSLTTVVFKQWEGLSRYPF